MKHITFQKPKFGWKTKLVALLGALIIALGFTWSLLMRLFVWNDQFRVVKQRVLEVKVQYPIRIEKREVKTQEIIKVIETIPNPEDLETDNEKYIYEKFGLENYKIALSIAMAESKMNCNAVGINENSADLGLFQVNTLWLKDYDLVQLADCKGNIDAAYRIWDRGDGEEGNNKGSWNPWTTAKNGAYLKFLE